MELSYELYAKGFSEFRKRCNSLQYYLNHCQKMLLNKHFENVLTIGGGNGCFDTQLSNVFSFNNYHVIEPNCDHINMFKQKVNNSEKYAFYQNDFQQWFDKNKQSNIKYDLIIASHCIYYFSNKDDFLLKCMSLLKKNGIMLVLVMHEESFNQIIKKFGNAHSLTTKCDQKDVKKILDRNDINYQVNDVDGEIDIRGEIDPSMFYFMLDKLCTQDEILNILDHVQKYGKYYPQKTSVFTLCHKGDN